MRAFVLHDICDFRLESVPEPVPKDNEVLVRVKAARNLRLRYSKDIPDRNIFLSVNSWS